MARDRQRAKQRQAARRAERLAERRGAPPSRRPASAGDSTAGDPPLTNADVEELADLEVGAPPQNVGRSDTVLETPPNPFDAAAIEDSDFDDEPEPTPAAGGGVERRATRGPAARHGRLVAFLIAVWAELGRVQWPDRRQLTQLTGVVLFFVLVIGGYLGGLDAIFSKLIQLIL